MFFFVLVGGHFVGPKLYNIRCYFPLFVYQWKGGLVSLS